jgi:hypothetical protein
VCGGRRIGVEVRVEYVRSACEGVWRCVEVCGGVCGLWRCSECMTVEVCRGVWRCGDAEVRVEVCGGVLSVWRFMEMCGVCGGAGVCGAVEGCGLFVDCLWRSVEVCGGVWCVAVCGGWKCVECVEVYGGVWSVWRCRRVPVCGGVWTVCGLFVEGVEGLEGFRGVLRGVEVCGGVCSEFRGVSRPTPHTSLLAAHTSTHLDTMPHTAVYGMCAEVCEGVWRCVEVCGGA